MRTLSAALTGEVSLTIRLWFPDRRCRDIDNVGKAIMDALNRVAWADSQVIQLVVTRAGVDRISLRAEIRIQALPPKAEVETHGAGGD